MGRDSGDGVTRIKDPFVHHIVIDGRLAGSWTRTVKGGSVAVECAMYARPNADVARAIDAAASRLGQFLKLPATSSWRVVGDFAVLILEHRFTVARVPVFEVTGLARLVHLVANLE
jgi:hypothetical protein